MANIEFTKDTKGYKTTAEVATLANCSAFIVLAVTREQHFPTTWGRVNHTQTKIWTEEQVKKILEAVKERLIKNKKWFDCAKNRDILKPVKKAASVKLDLEKLKSEHPLVTDERCFHLSWFPDTEPKNFEEIEKED